MEIRDLNYFRTVVDAGGVTRAAGLLHLSPGAVSKALRRFEDDIGEKLLKRVGRNLAMTEVGKQLYHRSTRLLEEHAKLLAEIKDVASAGATPLRIASFEVFTGAYLASMLEEHWPDHEVEILDLLVGDIEQAILERRVDYGLTYVPFPHRDLAFRRLGRLEMGVFGRRGAFKGVPLSEVPFAIPVNRVQQPGGEHMGIDGWPYQRFPRAVRYRLTTMQSAIELAVRGLAVLMTAKFIAGLHNTTAKRSRQLVRWPNPPGMGRLHQQLHLICRNADATEPRTGELASVLRATLTRLNAARVPTTET